MSTSPDESKPNLVEAHQLGWLRRSELDRPGMEAWELPDGTLLAHDGKAKLQFLVLRNCKLDGKPVVILAPATILGTEATQQAIGPHAYSPGPADAMGDCTVCGRTRTAPVHKMPWGRKREGRDYTSWPETS